MSRAEETDAFLETGVLAVLLHPVRTVVRYVSVDFDFDGCVLCDDETLHADLAALFERRS